jgi:predicted solute-binding protein
VSESHANLGMHSHDILEYTQGLRYFMGVPEQRAIDLFRQYLDQLDAAESHPTMPR